MPLTWKPLMDYPLAALLEPPAMLSTMYEVTTAGKSGLSEPAWPTTPGTTVVDGTITWTARAAMTITWTASPLYKTGAAQPTWPTTIGATVVDNGITWTTSTPAITDPKCPQSKVALPIASKIYSPYRDVVRYCVTDNPRDWSTPNDAGFLPTGQHSPTSPEATALAEYRSRLVVWTPSHLQVWTVDPNPAENELYDSIPGFGTMYPDAVVSVIDDLYFMTKLGIRSLSITLTSNTLQSGDVGSGIDPLIQARLAGPIAPIATYYPGNGQAWFIFDNMAYVYSRSRQGKVGAWSWFEWPWTVTDVLQLNGELYLRANDNFYRLDESRVDDDGVEFEGVVWTPHLDLGSPGVAKMLYGFDLVAYGNAEISVGYNQRDTSLYTGVYAIGPDTVPGGVQPMGVVAPSMAFKIRFPPGQAWQLNALNVYVEDLGLV